MKQIKLDKVWCPAMLRGGASASKPIGAGLTFLVAALALALLTSCGGKSALKENTRFFPPPPQLPRVQFLVRYHNSRDLGIKTGGFRKFVTGEKETTDQLIKPHSAAYYKGKLYVADSRRFEVVVMDIVNKTMEPLGKEEGIVFAKPLSVAIADDGTKYIADNGRKRIFVFNDEDKYQSVIGRDGQFSPTSIAVRGDKLYVADVDGKEVEIIDRNTGEVIQTLKGSEESSFGLFRMPVNLTVSPLGHLYVSDMLSNTVFEFDDKLEFVRNYGRPGDTYGTFSRARGVAVDSSGYLLAVDAAFENVQIFEPKEGNLVLFFGGSGGDPGDMYLPSGVTISYSDIDVFGSYVDPRFEMEYIIVVANQYSQDGVSVYGFGKGDDKHFEDFSATPLGPDSSVFKQPVDSDTLKNGTNNSHSDEKTDEGP
jgi:DNA-binding beta-propeller fold protein YncE